MKKAAAKPKPKTAARKPAKKNAGRGGRSGSIRVNDQVWPMERDVLFRPDRFKYVRKLVKPGGCVFCRAAKEKPSFDTLCVHQDDNAMVVLNKFPYNSGHLLILPRRHCGDLLALSDKEYAGVTALTRTCLRALNELYQPGGVNVGLNHGAVAGAGIPEHLHFHMIPRWSGDVNFFPLIADTKVLIENLEQTWDRLSAWFASGRPS